LIIIIIIIIIIIYLFIYLFELEKSFLPSGSGTTVRHNTHITQNNMPHSKHGSQNYKMKNTSHTVNRMQRRKKERSKVISVTVLGGL
jgi:hypothetical protein